LTRHFFVYGSYFWIALGIISLLGNAKAKAAEPEVRRKSRVILWGTVLGVLPIVLERAAVDFFGYQPSFWIDWLFFVILLLYPLSFAYAVVKHRVMEIPVLLKRSARYVLVQRGFFVLLFAAAATAIALFTHTISRFFPQGTNIGMAMSAVFGIALVWVSAPIVKRGTERIDRAFFRSAYDARRILENLAEKTREVTDRHALANLLTSQIAGALHPKSLACYLEDGSGNLVAEGAPISDETIAPPAKPPSQEVNPDATLGDSFPATPPSGGRPLSGMYVKETILQPGDLVGARYEILQLLGEGGMGKVYKALDKELGRTVALKTLQPELTRDPNVILRFKQELLLASKISHKHILRIHDLSEWEGVKFITMAFIEGSDLSELLKGERPFSIERSVKIARQLCEALDAAHSEGVVHRDFKPQNVLVGKHDHVYVSDFGLATSLETAKLGMTRTGAFVGTPRYMSPEQVEGKHVDSRSDLYSLGLVIYEMVSGDVPFAGDSAWQVMYQRVKEMPKNVREVNPDIPDALARIIMHCLERDAAERYQTAKEILADIDAHRGPEMSRTSMYRTASSSTASRSLQITLPAKAPVWLYVAGGIVLIGGAFFTVPATRHLVIKPAVETGGVTSETVQGLPPLSQGKYVAVLPFRVLGDASTVGYVAEGLGEALSAKLFQLKAVHVASSDDSRKMDLQAPLPQIAKKLGANMVVQGTLQGNAEQLRITVKLENVVENKTVWNEEFSGVPGDLLTMEDKIYAKLADALESSRSVEELAAGTAHPTDNVDAYDSYLRGRNVMRGQLNPKTMQSAMDYFSAAIRKDPSFALAYSGLADASLRMYDDDKRSLWTDKALAAAKQAESLNGKLPEVHFSLSGVYAATGQTTQAIAEVKRALELAPNSDEGYRRLGSIYLKAGQKEQGVRALERAVEMNPYYWANPTALANAYFSTGEFDKAIKYYQQVTQMEPQNSIGFVNLGAAYVDMGRYEDSIAPLETAMKLDPDPMTISNLGTSLFYLHRYAEAAKLFEKAVQLNPNDEMFMGNLADSYRAAGQLDMAKATYDKAIGLCFKALQVNPRNAAAMGDLALYLAKKGDAGQAMEFAQRARGLDPLSVQLMVYSAMVHTLGNRPVDAVDDLRKALHHGYTTASIESEPEFDPLRKRPDFQALIVQFAPRKK
jgi:serine/threonine-protein kinase